MLISVLLGINWPKDAVGVFPGINSATPEYSLLKQNEQEIAFTALTNARVCCKNVIRKSLQAHHDH